MDIEYPVVAYSMADRIAGAVTAYACGDALGLPWEQFPPAGASMAEIEGLPAREGWERGATLRWVCPVISLMPPASGH